LRQDDRDEFFDEPFGFTELEEFRAKGGGGKGKTDPGLGWGKDTRGGLGLPRVAGDIWVTWGGIHTFDGQNPDPLGELVEIARIECPTPRLVWGHIQNNAPVGVTVDFFSFIGVGRIEMRSPQGGIPPGTTVERRFPGRIIRIVARHTFQVSAGPFNVQAILAPQVPWLDFDRVGKT